MRLSSLQKVSFKYGLIGFVLASLIVVVLFFTGTHPLLIFPLFDFRIFLFAVFIYFATREYKDYYNGGFLQFWQGLVIGLIVYLTIGILTSIFITAFSELNPDFLQQYIDGNISGMEVKKESLVNNETDIAISEEEYNRQIELLKATKPYLLGADYLLKSCIIGFFVTLLMAVILRKSEPRLTNRGN